MPWKAYKLKIWAIIYILGMTGHKSSSKLPISQCKERNMTHYISHRVCELRTNQDFPGGRVIKTPPSQCRGHGFDSCSGKTQHAMLKKKKKPPVISILGEPIPFLALKPERNFSCRLFWWKLSAHNESYPNKILCTFNHFHNVIHFLQLTSHGIMAIPNL